MVRKKGTRFAKTKKDMAKIDTGEVLRKSIDLTPDAWKALKIQAIKKDFKNLKQYCEHLLTEISKGK